MTFEERAVARRPRSAGYPVRIVTLALVLACPLGSAAFGEADGRWIVEAAAFVQEATGAPVPETGFHRVPAARLDEAIFAGRPLREDWPEVGAAFDPGSGLILLADDLDLSRVFDRSYLVHEMVHAQQVVTGRAESAPCLGRLEGEAYAVQARFLRSYGMRQEAFLADLLGLLQSACSYAY